MELHFAVFFGNKCCDVSLPLLNSSVLLLLLHHLGKDMGSSGSLQSFSLPSVALLQEHLRSLVVPGSKTEGPTEEAIVKEASLAPNFTPVTLTFYIMGGGVNRCSQGLLGKVAFPLLGYGESSHEPPLTSQTKA